MLESITIKGVGPVSPLNAQFAPRMNVITGDNGLGKSFLLDVCFWALTGTWPAGKAAVPRAGVVDASISWVMQSKTTTINRDVEFDQQTQSWTRKRGRPPMPGLVVYGNAAGNFAVWDPARNYWRDGKSTADASEWPRAFLFAAEQAQEDWDADSRPRTSDLFAIHRDIANGLVEYGHVVCSGLIADWTNWYYQRSSEPDSASAFNVLEHVVSVLSHPTEQIRCAAPERVLLNDSRRFPAIDMPYGRVPYPQWSAGVKRIIHFAYLLVWAWMEHREAAKLRGEEPTKRMVLLVDEMESHLHPRWQRSILPAILKVAELLSPDLTIQIIATTHSPLVLASLEPGFDEVLDQLFCFNFDPKAPRGEMVTFDALPWVNHGDAVGWLTSDVFGLTQARSNEAEIAIEAAEAFARGDLNALPDNLQTRDAITKELQRVLGSMDPFWPRWLVQVRQ